MTTTAARAMATLAAAVTLTFGAAAPALAAAPITPKAPATQVLVSDDGEHFGTALGHGLFDFAGPMIPGGSTAASLFVRNPTNRPVVLSLATTDVAFSNQQFADALTVIVSGQGSGAAPVTLGRAAPCAALLTGSRLPANATERIDLALAMADVTGRFAQGQTATFNVRVAMTDAVGAPPADGCGPGVEIPGLSATGGRQASGTAQAGLARTGSDVWPPLLLGTALLGAGLAILAARRRGKRDEREHRA